MQHIIERVIRNEGGFVNLPKKAGGPTKFGVTQRTYEAYIGRSATAQEIKGISVDTAVEIYERNYFTGPRINTLDDLVQPIMLDMALTIGPKVAIKLLQRLINAAGFGPTTMDGVIGPQTRAGVSSAVTKMGKVFVNALVEEWKQHYRLVVAGDPDKKILLDGWLQHADSHVVD